MPCCGLLIALRFSALLRLWTSFSNGPTAWQIDLTYALGLTELPSRLDPECQRSTVGGKGFDSGDARAHNSMAGECRRRSHIH